MELKNKGLRGKFYLLLSLIFLSLLFFRMETTAIQDDSSIISSPIINDLTPHAEIIILTDQDFGPLGYNFPGDGSPGNPYRIENYNITGAAFGILINGTGTANGFNVSFEINNCWITADDVCIRIIDAYPSLVKIHNCTCINTHVGDGIGIWLQRCDGAILTENNCNFNLHSGIRIDTCGGIIAENNTCYNNGDEGFYIDNAADNGMYKRNEVILNGGHGIINEISHNNVFLYNTIANNTYEGIYISTSMLVTIENNTIETNGLGSSARGIYFANSINGLVIYNSIIKNDGFGLSIDHVSGNLIIHHNNFIQNNQGGIQADEDYIPGHINSTWYDVGRLEGNYYSDYGGTGPYYIAGNCFNFDPYPLGAMVVITGIIPEYPFGWMSLVFVISLIGISTIFLKKR
ncbi:MAG: hypothetical protein GOP50_10130 [Candidatus Heimdallarchaeota archaeon]|nr:hypothetical protein [Candidatus Heimdallarchaeota archaeon]